MIDPLFAFLAENSADVLWRIGSDHIIRYISPSVTQLLGYQPEELIGQPATFGVYEEDLPVLQAAARRVYEPGAELPPQTLRLRRRDGSLVWVESQVRAMFDEAGVPTGAALIMRDITERKRVDARVLRKGMAVASELHTDESLTRPK